MSLTKLKTIISSTTVPYDNMALEAYLLHHVEPGECILYLWQNRQTVVIGRNQNGFKECRCRQLEAEGGYLARRLSGGGAVFHDLGNLNFTFLVRKEDYSVERQTEVILQAVRAYGVHAERTGRNDIVADGRKFSGNAYYQAGDCCYHHGTILINADREAMSRYLNVSREKLRSKGVDSVRSRVVNLAALNPGITVDGMKERLTEAFALVYGGKAEAMSDREIDWEEVREQSRRFASWEWLYGRKIPFTCEVERRFSWGGMELQLFVDGGRIREVGLYTDALDVELTEALKKVLTGLKYQTDVLISAIREVPVNTELQGQMKQDMITWLGETV